MKVPTEDEYEATATDQASPYRKKLIEVDLPLARINKVSAREMAGRLPLGHPATLHTWWARRPLAACRAVVFASMVDDPSSCPEEFDTEHKQQEERARLHEIIERLVEWKNISDQNLLHTARREIARSVARARHETAPSEPSDVLAYLRSQTIYDPFSGRGSIPVEAQRLGMHAIGTDLNPIAVLITRALVELPPKFQNRPPVNPDAGSIGTETWRGASGLAEDIRWYGRWIRDQAWERVGRAYPKAKLPGGGESDVTAWLWARTVPCPNPACGAAMPLLNTFRLSNKKGGHRWIKPIVVDIGSRKRVSFEVQNHDDGVPARGSVTGAGATCLVCGSTAPRSYLRDQARAGRMDQQMTAMVVAAGRERVFVSPNDEHERVALSARPAWQPEQEIPATAHKVDGQRYGLTHWHQMFTRRQLLALTTLSDLVVEARTMLARHGADEEYANAVATYLALGISKTTNFSSSFCRWKSSAPVQPKAVFSRPAIPMVWDFAEANPLLASTGVWDNQVKSVASAVAATPVDVDPGEAHQANAATTIHAGKGPVIVTDPPYYDNYSYAELSDFFYVWLRPLLRDVWPDLFAGMLTPLQEEMIAAPRFENTRERFEELLNQTLSLIRERCSPEFPSSIFYAYKQQEEERANRTSTGWETMLSALVSAEFRIVGTWPMDTETGSRSNSLGTNSLASSVVLVCRPRPSEAPTATRREFLDALDRELPVALDQLTREGHIAPVDLAQAAIGPGMEVYSRYSRVETIAGEVVTVREALGAINRAVAEYHRREEGNLDAPSRLCMDWLRQYGYAEGQYGGAEGLARAMNVSLGTPEFRRLLVAQRSHVQLLAPNEFRPDPQLSLDGITAWEGCFRMAYHLDTGREDGEGLNGAARVAVAMGSAADSAERLARILYAHFDSTDDSTNAVRLNNLVTSWPEIERAMLTQQRATQGTLTPQP